MVEDDYIKSQIETAIRLVNELDEKYKIPAFQVILASLLQNSSKTTSLQRNETISNDNQNDQTNSSNLEGFAKKCSVTPNDLKDIFKINDDGTVELLIKLKDDLKEKEKQVLASQIIILALEVLQKQEWVESTILTKSLELSGVSSSHLARTMNDNNRIFRPSGTGKGTKYKLSGPGRSETFTLIHNLVKNQ